MHQSNLREDIMLFQLPKVSLHLFSWAGVTCDGRLLRLILSLQYVCTTGRYTLTTEVCGEVSIKKC